MAPDGRIERNPLGIFGKWRCTCRRRAWQVQTRPRRSNQNRDTVRNCSLPNESFRGPDDTARARPCIGASSHTTNQHWNVGRLKREQDICQRDEQASAAQEELTAGYFTGSTGTRDQRSVSFILVNSSLEPPSSCSVIRSPETFIW